MKKFVLALTALAAFTGSAVAADLPAPDLLEGSGGGGDSAELDRLLHLRRCRRRRLGCRYQRQLHCDGGLRSVHQSAGRVATAGSVRSVPVMTGSSTSSVGVRHSGRRPVRQPARARSTTFGRRYRQRKAAGHLGRRRSRRLSGRAECAVLRQRRLHRLALVGLDSCSARRLAQPSGIRHRRFNAQRLVRRWRRREQPGHLRHHGARLVHEDRIPRRLLRSTRTSTSLRRSSNAPTGFDRQPSSRWCRPSAPRWSIASTGPARWSRSTDLTSTIPISEQKPRHRPGLFCALLRCLVQTVALEDVSALLLREQIARATLATVAPIAARRSRSRESPCANCF